MPASPSLSGRPEARKDETRRMLIDAADHLQKLAARHDLTDHEFDGCLGLEILLLTNARQHWKKAVADQTHALALLAQHHARYERADAA